MPSHTPVGPFPLSPTVTRIIEQAEQIAELVEALEAIVGLKYIGGSGMGRTAVEIAQKALAKAKGGD